MRLRSVRRNKLGVSLAVALILAGVVVDLRFSAHPALSIGIRLGGCGAPHARGPHAPRLASSLRQVTLTPEPSCGQQCAAEAARYLPFQQGPRVTSAARRSGSAWGPLIGSAPRHPVVSVSIVHRPESGTYSATIWLVATHYRLCRDGVRYRSAFGERTLGGLGLSVIRSCRSLTARTFRSLRT